MSDNTKRKKTGNRLKKQVRARMEVTGEKYTAALRALQAQEKEEKE